MSAKNPKRNYGRIALSWRARLAVAVFSFLLALLLRFLGGFEQSDLSNLDLMRRVLQNQSNSSGQTVVVAFDDSDLEEIDWPVSDDRLASVLRQVLAAGPVAVGLDIYRDRPVPPGHETLSELFASDVRLFAVFKFALAGEVGVAPPPALVGTGRAGFSDALLDGDGSVRRMALFLDDGKSVATSLPFLLASAYLLQKGIAPVAASDDPSVLQLGEAKLPPLPENFGAYRGPLLGYQLALDFKVPAVAVPVVSAGDLARDPDLARAFSGKIVLVGTISEIVRDFFPTAGGGAIGSLDLTPGVVLHALAVDQLLRLAAGRTQALSAAPLALELGLAGVLVLLAAIAAGLRGGLRLSAPAGLAVLLALWAVGLALLWGNFWLPLSMPAAAFFLTLSLLLYIRAKQERRVRHMLSSLFAQQVSPEVAEELWARRQELLAGERLVSMRGEATLMFVDIVGSSTRAQASSPDDFTKWINQVLEIVANEVISAGGLVEKFMGDGLLAAFNLPVPKDGDGTWAANSAVTCARRIVDAHRRGVFPGEGSSQTKLRIGIESGQVLAGTVGPRSRQQFTVMGDTVNIAARLESLARDDRFGSGVAVAIGEACFAKLADRSLVKQIGGFELRGREGETMVYTLA